MLIRGITYFPEQLYFKMPQARGNALCGSERLDGLSVKIKYVRLRVVPV